MTLLDLFNQTKTFPLEAEVNVIGYASSPYYDSKIPVNTLVTKVSYDEENNRVDIYF